MQEQHHLDGTAPDAYPVRSTMRLRHFDYSTPGAYFITICTDRRVCHFGQVRDDAVCLTAVGSMVASVWSQLSTHYPAVQTDAFVIMPNHIHGILLLTDDHHRHTSPDRGQVWEPAPTTDHQTPAPGYGVITAVMFVSDIVFIVGRAGCIPPGGRVGAMVSPAGADLRPPVQIAPAL